MQERFRGASSGTGSARRLPQIWPSGKPRCAAAYRELAAEARRCAALTTSLGLRAPCSGRTNWLEAAATFRQTADSCELLAQWMAGWGWRKPWLVSALKASLVAVLLGAALLLVAAATLPAHWSGGS